MTTIIHKTIRSLVFWQWEVPVTVILRGRLLPHQLGMASTPWYLPHPPETTTQSFSETLWFLGRLSALWASVSAASCSLHSERLAAPFFLWQPLRNPAHAQAVCFSLLPLILTPTLTLTLTLHSAQAQHWPHLGSFCPVGFCPTKMPQQRCLYTCWREKCVLKVNT